MTTCGPNPMQVCATYTSFIGTHTSRFYVIWRAWTNKNVSQRRTDWKNARFRVGGRGKRGSRQDKRCRSLSSRGLSILIVAHAQLFVCPHENVFHREEQSLARRAAIRHLSCGGVGSIGRYARTRFGSEGSTQMSLPIAGDADVGMCTCVGLVLLQHRRS
jgi:hypothetical protein